jgi:hypothetical protein
MTLVVVQRTSIRTVNAAAVGPDRSLLRLATSDSGSHSLKPSESMRQARGQ